MSTRLTVFSLIASLDFGCRGPSAGDEPGPPDKVSDTARIVCDGARVLTPEVEVRAGGAHLAVDHRDGGEGWSVPPGEGERVANAPPGTLRIGC